MVFELKRIDVWTCTKIAFFLCGIFGLLIGLFYALIIAMVGSFLGPLSGGELGSLGGIFSGALGIFIAFFLAIFYAVFGAILTAISAWLYNIFAKSIGGVKITLNEEKPATITSVPPEEKSPGSYKYE
jgi:hypothetical protein